MHRHKRRFLAFVSSWTVVVAFTICADAFPVLAGSLPEIPVVTVNGGCFDMGDSLRDGGLDEKPVHQVCVDSFRMGIHEVTQQLWTAVMGDNPSKTRGSELLPVDNVSWNDAQAFIRKLNEISGGGWRLPTEAEWEFAARSGGLKQRYSGTSSIETLSEYAWFEDNSAEMTHPVGTRKPNALGLYDMSGNVWEWCSDRYDRHYYRQSPHRNPKGDPFAINRVVRGGSALSHAGFLRTTYRDYSAPATRGRLYGLRLAADEGNEGK